MNTKANRYKELDSLRGIAAIMVVFFHFTMGRAEAKYGFKLGTTGVDLFFIISGFVIFMSLTKVNSGLEFVINRVSRLYPTYWTCVTITFIVYTLSLVAKQPGWQQIHLIQYLGNMTMFQYYLRIPDIDGPYWTMIIEMVFYIGMLCLFQLKWMNYLNTIGLFLCISLAGITSVFPNKDWLHLLFKVIPLLQFIPLFFSGILFYKLFHDKTKQLELYFYLLICLSSQIVLFNYSGRSKMFINQGEYATMLVLYFSLFFLFVNGKLVFIISKPLLFLGKISFALYLIHQFISIELLLPWLLNHKLNFWLASVCIILPVLISLAASVTYLVEVPYSKRMKTGLKALAKIK